MILTGDVIPLRKEVCNLAALRSLNTATKKASFKNKTFIRHTNPDGTVGGFVESTALVDRNVYVSQKALILGLAQVLDNAQILDRTQVCDNARVSGNARVCGNAVVESHAQVCDNAMVGNNSVISGNVKVFGSAEVYGEVWLVGNAQISKGILYTQEMGNLTPVTEYIDELQYSVRK